MSLVNILRSCRRANAWTYRSHASSLVPFIVECGLENHLAGWVHEESDFVAALVAASPLFTLERHHTKYKRRGKPTAALVCSFARDATMEDRCAAVAPVLAQLHSNGLVPGWRDELYPCAPLVDTFTPTPNKGGSHDDYRHAALHASPASSAALFSFERAAATRFGVAQFGVHVNVWSRGGGIR